MHTEDWKALENIGKAMLALMGVTIVLIALANTLS